MTCLHVRISNDTYSTYMQFYIHRYGYERHGEQGPLRDVLEQTFVLMTALRRMRVVVKPIHTRQKWLP